MSGQPFVVQCGSQRLASFVPSELEGGIRDCVIGIKINWIFQEEIGIRIPEKGSPLGVRLNMGAIFYCAYVVKSA